MMGHRWLRNGGKMINEKNGLDKMVFVTQKNLRLLLFVRQIAGGAEEVARC